MLSAVAAPVSLRVRAALLRAVLLLAPLSVFGIAPSASASLMLALDLAALVARASQVVVARVESQHPRWDERGRIVTDVTLRVDETLFGAAQVGDRVVLERFGGAIGELGMRIEGEPLFADGTRVLVFAAPAASGSGRLRPVGMSQGVMHLAAPEVRGGEERVLPGGEGLALVQAVRGALVPAPPALATPRPLGEVRAAVRQLREAQRAP